MAIKNYVVLLVTHLTDIRTLVQFYMHHQQNRDITAVKEHPSSGWDRPSMRRCWQLLGQITPGYAAANKQLEGDLARTLCLFYLVLRGLDTIEDDMTIPDDIKQPILRSFHKHTVTPGWKFDGNDPNEKDRQLLVEYDTVISEVNLLLPSYRDIIVDITERMATGMADFSHKAATAGHPYVETIAEYDLYNHYVSGIVIEGIARVFSASGKEAESLKDQLELANSMGLLVSKADAIQDYREDVDQCRYLWPREIWGDKKYGFQEMKDMYAPGVDVRRRATWAQSGMIADALRHVIDVLDYLKLFRNQSIFKFSAMLAVVAFATLELCFMNEAMFDRKIEIRKAKVAQLMMRSTCAREVALIFCEYACKIRAKALPADPNFLKIVVACAEIEQWRERHYPSFIVSYRGVANREK